MLFERQSLNDILTETPELLVRGDWQCLNIETKTPWPTKAQSMTFEGHLLWLMPHTTHNYPGIAINRPADMDADDAWALLHRALSLIAWTENTGAMVAHMSGGNLPRMMGLNNTSGIAIRDGFDFSDLKEAPDDRGKIALALIREGRGLNHPAYAFLSFFRALETAIPHGPTRGAWVTANIDNIPGHRAAEALAKLRQNVAGDIGEHLRDSGRHAIAHARDEPIINPDDPRDARRLREELPVMEGLAVLAIETELGILTRTTIWKQHLYELRGWKAIFGEQLIAEFLEGKMPVDGQQVDAPNINVRVWRSAPFAPLENMLPVQASYGLDKVEVVYRSQDGLVDLVFWLNFAAERLEFDLERSIVAYDDGSVSAARNGRELHRFSRDYFGNGSLQMWNAETGTLISRCDPFMPVNCYLDIDASNAAAERWDKIIAERETANPE